MTIKNILEQVLLLSMLFSGSVLSNEGSNPASNPDPYENFNRKVYAFNEFADRIVLSPLARGYQVVTPQLVNDGVSNFLANLSDVNSALNCLMQFNFDGVAVEAGRVLLNTTVGLLGFFDVASAVGIDRSQADFGQTLAVWGVESGPYLVLPLFGPATVRSGLGDAVDSQLSWLGYVEHVPTRNSTYAVDVTDRRADLLRAEELISGDRYIFLRDAFLQRRQFLVSGEVADDFGEEDFDWDE